MEKKDITSLDDIKIMVNNFYIKVREDDLIGPIFNRIIEDRWSEHLDKMYRFWQTVLLSEHTYSGSPFAPHATMPIEGEHFERWKKIFKDSIEENFEGEKTEEAKWRAEKMAAMFLMKISHFRSAGVKPII